MHTHTRKPKEKEHTRAHLKSKFDVKITDIPKRNAHSHDMGKPSQTKKSAPAEQKERYEFVCCECGKQTATDIAKPNYKKENCRGCQKKRCAECCEVKWDDGRWRGI